MAGVNVGIDPKTLKYASVGIGVVAVGTIGFIVIKKVRQKSSIKADIKNFKKNAKPNTINPVGVAEQLGMDLGYAYPAWDPRRWTENDSAVIKTLKTIPTAQMQAVQIAYLKKYTRNLREDLKKLLDDDYSQVKYLFGE